MHSASNAMTELNGGILISTPFNCEGFLLLFGNLFFLCVTVWMIASFILRFWRLLRCPAMGVVLQARRENYICLALGWVSFAVGFILTWHSLYSTWSKCSWMVERAVDRDLVLIVFLSSRDDIWPFMIGCLVLMFSQFRSSFVCFMVRRLRESNRGAAEQGPPMRSEVKTESSRPVKRDEKTLGFAGQPR